MPPEAEALGMAPDAEAAQGLMAMAMVLLGLGSRAEPNP